MTVLVVHTTETPAGTARSVARQLLERGSAPHQVYDPSDGTVVHCHDWNTPARALKNLAGGVKTNRRGGVMQVEIIGYAAHVPGYNDAWYANLGRYLNHVCDQTGTPKTFPLPFGGNETYGRTKPTRLSFAGWQSVAGIIGHQHVPENDHWDPGRLDVARLIPHMQGDIPAMTPEQQTHFDHRFGLLEQYLTEVEQRTAQRIADSEARQNTVLLAALPSGARSVIAGLDDDQLQAIAKAVADEHARRLGNV